MATEQHEAEHAGLLFPISLDREAQTEHEAEGALGPQAEQDLELGVLARAIAGRGHGVTTVLELLRRPVRDPEVLAHRYSLLNALYRDEQLRLELERVLPTLAELSTFRRAAAGNESQVLQTIWRLGELELYVAAVERLQAALVPYYGGAGSVAAMAERVSSLYQDELFGELRAELPRLQEAIRKRRSITIGINLDERLRPTEAALLSINAERIGDRSLLGGFLARLFSTRGSHQKSGLRSEGAVHYARLPRELAGGEERPALTPLFRDLETLLDRTTRPVQHALERYLRIETLWLGALRDELGPFCGAAALMHRIENAGLPVCVPTIAARHAREFRAERLYNPRLALQALDPTEKPSGGQSGDTATAALEAEKHSRSRTGGEAGTSPPVVTNDAEFNDTARAFILTGPNHGGKTTYTQAVGMAFVLAQAGFFVPASSAVVSPADRIETHFPAPEAPEADGGRLAEEVSRLSQLFDTVTPESVVLLNESLASTGAGEAAYLAEDLVRGLCIAGCRTVFATHLHELAARIDEINASIPDDTKPDDTRHETTIQPGTTAGETKRGGSTLASLVACGRTHERPFSVVRSAPVGRSFAHEIAEQHGMSLEAIRARLRRRGIL